MNVAAEMSDAPFREGERRGVDLLILADRLGVAPYSLTKAHGFRPLLASELDALCRALSVRPAALIGEVS